MIFSTLLSPSYPSCTLLPSGISCLLLLIPSLIFHSLLTLCFLFFLILNTHHSPRSHYCPLIIFMCSLVHPSLSFHVYCPCPLFLVFFILLFTSHCWAFPSFFPSCLFTTPFHFLLCSFLYSHVQGKRVWRDWRNLKGNFIYWYLTALPT